MSRSAPLALLVGGVLVFGGCSGSVPLGAEPTAPPSPTPTVPERPAGLTNDSVATYVQTHERAIQFQEADDADRSVEVQCDAVVGPVTETGSFATASCTVQARSNGVGHGVTGPIVYFVNDTETIRIDPSSGLAGETEVRNPYTGPNETASFEVAPPEYAVVNADGESHDLNVTLTYLDTSTPETALADTHHVKAHAGIRHTNVVRRPGTYRVNATLEDGRTAILDWQVGEEEGQALTIYIAPGGELLVRLRPDVEFLCC